RQGGWLTSLRCGPEHTPGPSAPPWKTRTLVGPGLHPGSSPPCSVTTTRRPISFSCWGTCVRCRFETLRPFRSRSARQGHQRLRWCAVAGHATLQEGMRMWSSTMPTWLHLLVMQCLLGLVFCAYLLTWLAVICLAAFLPSYLAGQALSGESLVFAAWLGYVLGVPATVFAGVWWLVDGPRAARDWFRASVAAACPACGKRAAYPVGSRPVRS